MRRAHPPKVGALAAAGLGADLDLYGGAFHQAARLAGEVDHARRPLAQVDEGELGGAIDGGDPADGDRPQRLDLRVARGAR